MISLKLFYIKQSLPSIKKSPSHDQLEIILHQTKSTINKKSPSHDQLDIILHQTKSTINKKSPSHDQHNNFLNKLIVDCDLKFTH